MIVDNSDGATVRADINSAFAAIVSNFSSATAPSGSNLFALMWWYDTANNVLKQRNEANTAWIPRADDTTTGSIASAAALPITTNGLAFDVTGTTTITSFSGMSVGQQVVLQFDGALTLTHHSTNLVLPGGVNITTVAGDVGVFHCYATNDVRLVSWSNAVPNDAVIKAWANYDHSANILRDSFNISSVSDDSNGNFTVNIDTNFASAYYSILATSNKQQIRITNTNLNVGDVSIRTDDSGGSAGDSDIACIMMIGGQ